MNRKEFIKRANMFGAAETIRAAERAEKRLGKGSVKTMKGENLITTVNVKDDCVEVKHYINKI